MGITELETFYSKVDFNVVSSARFFPHIASFVGREVKFRYERYTYPIPGGPKAVFIAKIEDGQKIDVKFVEAYNDAAHTLLSARGLAPEVPSEVLEQVGNPLDRLHGEGFVFGDLGWPNALVTLAEGWGRVQLVDFDWYGKVGEGVYPSDMGVADIKWPRGVVPGGLIEFEHDRETLSRL